jgi:hypothetical protein
VAITPTLKGLVPKLHMTDSGAGAGGGGSEGGDKKSSKFKAGKKLAAR